MAVVLSACGSDTGRASVRDASGDGRQYVVSYENDGSAPDQPSRGKCQLQAEQLCRSQWIAPTRRGLASSNAVDDPALARHRTRLDDARIAMRPSIACCRERARLGHPCGRGFGMCQSRR